MRFASRSGLRLGAAGALLAAGAAVVIVVRSKAGRDPAQAILLAGSVEDRRGKPVAGARLFAWPVSISGEENTSVTEIKTFADGRFRLVVAQRGIWTMLVEAPGFGSLLRKGIVVPGKPLVVRLESEGRALKGNVTTEDGSAAAGAHVLLAGTGIPAARTAITDGQGGYVFADLAEGQFVLRASRGALASAPSIVDFDPGKPENASSAGHLRLLPGGFVEGRVAGGDGRPLPGAALELLALPADDCPASVRAGATGRFSLGPVPAGDYRLFARVPGSVLAPLAVTVRAGASTVVDVGMARSASLAGRVVDGRGRPLGGVSITLQSTSPAGEDLVVLPHALPLAAEAADLPGAFLPAWGVAKKARTGNDGQFLLDDLLPGKFRIEFDHRHTTTLRLGPIALDGGDQRSLGEIVLVSPTAP